jgi:hypothetical protein
MSCDAGARSLSALFVDDCRPWRPFTLAGTLDSTPLLLTAPRTNDRPRGHLVDSLPRCLHPAVASER